MLSEQDKSQIIKRGSDIRIVEDQINRFRNGFPFAQLVKPATKDSGILSFSDKEKLELSEFFDKYKSGYIIGRFVPASGAATRMFKSLYTALDTMKDMTSGEQKDFVKQDKELAHFFSKLESYAFYKEIRYEAMEGPSALIKAILEESGLGYGSKPKGLIKFHSYPDGNRTAFEEHLHEAARIMLPVRNIHLHFTVSEEHLQGFKYIESKALKKLEDRYDVKYEISYSFQKKETDTIAVDLNNEPFRDEDGLLVFRPGGHGALIENLNDLDYDIAFINNIDNVSPDSYADLRLINKKLLGGLLLKLSKEADDLRASLLAREPASDKHALKWLKEKINLGIEKDIDKQDVESISTWLIEMLDRPLRVCGMVKNEGEPGGGPFFVKNSKGGVSLQIVETSQVDTSNKQQLKLLKEASHFNPVDIACRLKRADGRSYDLDRYIDPETGFISSKSVKGRDLKALELPGLWNGSMSGWLTVFVEIPASTFTPVKTIFDLVRSSHT